MDRKFLLEFVNTYSGILLLHLLMVYLRFAMLEAMGTAIYLLSLNIGLPSEPANPLMTIYVIIRT
jgi:hypothetical protein